MQLCGNRLDQNYLDAYRSQLLNLFGFCNSISDEHINCIGITYTCESFVPNFCVISR